MIRFNKTQLRIVLQNILFLAAWDPKVQIRFWSLPLSMVFHFQLHKYNTQTTPGYIKKLTEGALWGQPTFGFIFASPESPDWKIWRFFLAQIFCVGRLKKNRWRIFSDKRWHSSAKRGSLQSSNLSNLTKFSSGNWLTMNFQLKNMSC